jgi:hypothetical protein
MAGFPFGFSMITIFSGTAIFLSSTYQKYAASAFAVNSWMRYTFAAVFPLFATQSMLPPHPWFGFKDANGSDWGDWNWLEYEYYGICIYFDDSYSVFVFSIWRCY